MPTGSIKFEHHARPPSVRLEITGVGLVVTDAGIIQGFCLQRLDATGVLITKTITKT